MEEYHDFPHNFLWGCATASYQVEGAAHVDGRTDSIWDTYCRKPGAVYAGECGEVSVDQYHRYAEDVALMARLGFKSYRFSISWTRLVPEKGGPVNQKGVEYYRNLCLELKKYGISPAVTLYHWDLPQYLENEGGWAARSTAYAFLDYAKLCFSLFGDVVERWFTLNEPYCSSYLGYQVGRHAPGYQNPELANKAVHHLNLAHGLAIQAYRKTGLTAQIGIVLNPVYPRPASGSEDDILAANLACAYETDIFLHPILGKGYPSLVTQTLGITYPIVEGDMDIIASAIDFLGINYYFENVVAYTPNTFPYYTQVPNWQQTTEMGWPIVPSGLLRLLRYISKESNNISLYITENGCACDDKVDKDGRVHDRERCEYLLSHIRTVRKAIEEGIAVKGYYVWSFIDNFEWGYGYTKRFGVVYADYASLERIPKDSAYLMRDLMAGFFHKGLD